MTDKMTIKLLAIFICIPILILAFAGCNNKGSQSSPDTEGTTAVSETQDTDNESGDPSEGEPSDGEPSGTDPSDTQKADDTKTTTTKKLQQQLLLPQT